MSNMRAVLLLTLTAAAGSGWAASEAPFCGDRGVWVQILGAGGPELNDGQAGSSYLVWIDNHARLLVDTGPGSSANFDRAGAAFADLDAIIFTHLHTDHTIDFPAFVQGSYFIDRERPLPVLGPGGNETFPDTKTFVERLIGREGAYAYLAAFLTYHSGNGGYKVNARNIPATGQRRWSGFGSQFVSLSAIPVHHGDAPTLAWRAEVGGQVIVFAGDFNNAKNVVAKFAENADALVVSHAIPESARGTARDLYAIPSQLGSIAQQAKARMLILGHRTTRTRGLETQSREAIEKRYEGSLIFANDMECWGL